MEGSLVAYKVFTNGSVLQASEVNENLMQQAVATFSNAAARTAAITSPLEGQLTYLLDVDRYEHWNGSSWVSPFGLTLLATASPSASSGVSFNNVFSDSYQTYHIYSNLLGNASAGLNLRLRSGGSDATTGYQFQYLEANSGSVTASADGTSQIFGMGSLNPSSRIACIADISNPFAAQQTAFFSRIHNAPYQISIRGGINNNNTSYDGCTIYPTGTATMSGSIRIYGVRN
jgi:hypothetical protein